MESSSTCAVPRARAKAAAKVVFPDPEHPTTAIRLISALLLGRPDQDLVHCDAPWLSHRVADRLSNVLGLHDLDPTEGLGHAFENLRAIVERKLGRGRSGLDQRDPHVTRRHLLAQRLAEGTDPVLGRVVDTAVEA